MTNIPKVALESGCRSAKYETGKGLVKSLWSLTRMRQQTHVNTHFLMLLQGGPLTTTNSQRGNKKRLLQMAWMTKREAEEKHENGWRCGAHLEDGVFLEVLHSNKSVRYFHEEDWKELTSTGIEAENK